MDPEGDRSYGDDHRPKELRDLLDSARSHSFDEVVVLDMASEPILETQTDVTTWERRASNVGCPAGRNELVSVSTSDVVVFVDDDAVLTCEGDHAALLRDFFDSNPRVGAVAGLIRRSDGHIERHEFPFPGDPVDVHRTRRAGCVLGGCAAMRRTAFAQVSGYDATFFYSMEELDLSTRLHQAGWEIWYLPALAIEHRPSEQGRVPDARVLALRLRNRLVYCRRSLPWPAAVVHGLIWSAIIGIDALRARAIRPWSSGMAEGLRTPVDRDPLTAEQARVLHRLGGRVWR